MATRAFGILGPLEALVEMVVFTVALWLAGWRPGEAFPTGPALAAASGGAFLTAVVMQMANAFACRSTRLPAPKEMIRRRSLQGAASTRGL